MKKHNNENGILSSKSGIKFSMMDSFILNHLREYLLFLPVLQSWEDSSALGIHFIVDHASSGTKLRIFVYALSDYITFGEVRVLV